MKSIKELMAMQGRVALIAGGGGHLGSAMAEALAEAGARIVILDVDSQAGERSAENLRRNYNAETLVLTADLESEAAVKQASAAAVRQWGRLDVVIHCAALVGTTPLQGWCVPFAEQSVETFRRCLEVNLTSAFALVQASCPALVASGHGTVILISSIYGLVGPNMSLYAETSMGNPAAYAASKGGLGQLARWLATNLAPHVRVNTITPGGVWRNQQETFHARYKALTPMGRMAVEEDFKGAALYLASDLSAYVTGQNLIVDGGWTAW